MSPAEIEALRAKLKQNPESAHRRFQEFLLQALNVPNFAQAQLLIEAAAPLEATLPYLHQWCEYARGCLALDVDHNPPRALQYLDALRTQHPDLAPDLLGYVLNSLGITCEVNEQWDRAQRYYEQALDYYDRENNEFRAAVILSNLAIVHFKGLNYARARECAEHSVAILRQKPDDYDWQYTLNAALNQLGLALRQLGRWPEALAAHTESLAIATRWGETWVQGMACNSIGDLHRLQGDLDTAREYYLRARQLSAQAGNWHQVAQDVYSLARLMLQVSALQETEALLAEAEALARQSSNHEIATQILLSRAALREQQGDPAAALEENRRAVAHTESLRANIVLPDDRARMTASRIEAYEQMVYRLYQAGTQASYAEAFYYAEMCKSRAFIELLAGGNVRRPSSVPPDWLGRVEELRRKLSSSYQRAETAPERIAGLEAELAGWLERIRLQDTEFTSLQITHPLTVEQAQARMPAHSVLVEYFTAGDVVLAFVITPETITMTQLPLRVRDLRNAFEWTAEGHVSHLRHVVRDGDQRLHAPWILGNLYQGLIRPLGDAVQSAALLCLVPHGLLHHVPFHALWMDEANGEASGHVFGERADIVYAPSAAVLFDYCQRKPAAAPNPCLALGYNGERLVQAEAEALAVGQIAGGQSYIGPDATRDRLFAEGRRYRHIHISCHGQFNPAWPMLSSLSLADGETDAAEILERLQLSADLVTLSACQTGHSHIMRGDELMGLVRAFIYAGTPSVLVSHWAVDELSTRLFMEHFYRQVIERHRTKAAAMSSAQRYVRTLRCDELRETLLSVGIARAEVENYLDRWARSAGHSSIHNLRGDECLLAHPYYWGAFFLVGASFAQ